MCIEHMLKCHEDIFWNKQIISIYIVVYLEVSTSIITAADPGFDLRGVVDFVNGMGECSRLK